MRLRAALLLFTACCARTGAAAPLTRDNPIPVRILYDNSGSMYPGYKPPDAPDRRSKAELGVGYLHQYAQFQSWLSDFADRQADVGGGTVGMWTFTSRGAFTPAGIRQVHGEVPVGSFDVARAIENFPAEAGNTTYLTETLQTFSRNFTGLIWLITDNIVETGTGQADADVERFFRTLNDDERYRSVHLFKYPFTDSNAGQTSSLAVYGILVSAANVDEATLAHYDEKFATRLRAANRRQGNPPAPLFPGREHLKLKNLRIDALTLRTNPTLTLILDDEAKDLLKEGQLLRMELAGEIKSNLTQHSVTGGRYELTLAAPFKPEEWTQRNLGAQPLPPEGFEPVGAEIQQAIPPKGTRDVRTVLSSSRPIAFSPRNPLEWMRLAMNGATVQYTGTVRMSFNDVTVRLERAQMGGIFGIDKASAIFNFQDVRTLDRIKPSEARVSFALKTGPRRTVILFAIVAVLVTLLTTLFFIVSRKQWCRIEISGAPERLIPMRRLGSCTVMHDGKLLGTVMRGFTGAFEFRPVSGNAAIAITPGKQPETWNVRFRDGGGCQLRIEPQGGAKTVKPRAEATVAPPSSARPSAGPRPAASLPRIDRP